MISAGDFALIAFCIVMETISALCFKRGVDEDEASPQSTNLLQMIIARPLFWLGILCWAIELTAWIIVLEHTPLSIAFPIMSLVYCSVPLAGYLFLKEPLPPRQWVATGLITVGVALVSSTGV